MKRLIPVLLLAFSVVVLNWQIGVYRDTASGLRKAQYDAELGDQDGRDITERAQKKDSK